MSERYFKVFGNFETNGKWSEPDPGFIGYVVMAENGVFEGFMEDLYPHPEGIDNSRFVIGKSFNEPIKKVSFLKLIKEYDYSPYGYKFSDISAEGQYNLIDPPIDTIFQGQAKISFEQISEISEDIRQKIIQIKDSVMSGPEWNKDLYEAAIRLYEAA